MDKERCLYHINQELNESYVHADVKKHYLRLQEIIKAPKNDYDGLKILLFQPCACGDNIIASIAAELFQIKYPGCTFDFFTSTIEAVPVLEANPFINKVICDANWELFRTRDTVKEKLDGKPTEDGILLKEYDMGYSLYWWDAPQIISFLEDLDLTTDYRRVRIYTQDQEFAKQVWGDTKELKIGIQIEGAKWDKTLYQQLKDTLKNHGKTLEFGKGLISFSSYIKDLAVIKEANIMVCTTGSIEHASAAVGTQTVVLSPIYNPTANCAYTYQNKYMPSNKQHLLVRPQDWCGNYACVSSDPDSIPYKQPPYNFSSNLRNRFPPHVVKSCDYKDFKKSCIHEIKPEEIVNKVKEAIKLRDDLNATM